MQKKGGIFQGWSGLELALLGVVVILCVGAGALALFLGGAFVFEGERAAQPAEQTPAAVATIAPIEAAATPLPDVDEIDQDQTTDTESPANQTITLNPSIAAPGTTVAVQGEGWPAGARIVISLVPSDPPSYAVNSALADDNGTFSVDIIVPSDPRWLNESPVPVRAETDDRTLSAQALLNFSTPGDLPAVTPIAVAVIGVVKVQPTGTPLPPPAGVAQLAATANVNIRKGPGTNYDILGVLLLGQQAEITGRNADGTWWQIKFPAGSGGVGWVSAAYVSAENIGNVPIVAAPPPPPTPPPTPTPSPGQQFPEWRGEYFSNQNLTGPPALVRNDPVISFDWGLGSPAPEIPVDNFSVRWTRTMNFSEGTYRFYARTDDGVRVWVDGALLINQWENQSPTTYAADVFLSAGPHTIQMDYFEHTLGAVAILSWQRTDPFPDWRAEYYNNVNLQGDPILVRNEPSINYNWTGISPAPGIVPVDNSSTRWTRQFFFENANYVFRVRSDDGVRVWVGNEIVIDRWQDGDSGWIEVQRNFTAGLRDMRVEYYKRGAEAFINFSWWRQDAVPNPPSAVIKAPSEGLTKVSVRFDGRSSKRGDYELVKYRWDFGDGTRAEGDRVNHTYDQPGEYKVRLEVTDQIGLKDSTSVKTRIKDNLEETTPPIAVITAPSNAREGDTVTFDASRTISISPIKEYSWSFGDGNSEKGQTVNHTYSRAGTYTVLLSVVAENGLRSSATQQIRIDSKLDPSDAPVARISAPGTAQINQPVTFDGSASTPANNLVSYVWKFGDGTEANAVTIDHAYDRTGVFIVTLTVIHRDGRSSQATHQIQITDAPSVPQPKISGPTAANVGDTVTFDGSASQSDVPVDDNNYVWNFGDGSPEATGKVVNHVYNAQGNYTVILTLTDQNGQSNSVTHDIQISAPPQPPTVVIDAPDRGTVGQSVRFDGSQSQSDAPIAQIEWNFGDNSPAADQLVVDHVYNTDGVYNVTLKLTDQNGNEDVAQHQVTIDPATPEANPPQAAISAPDTAIVNQKVTFDGSGSKPGDAAISSYEWEFGDGNTATDPVVDHVFTAPGQPYWVNLTVTDANGEKGYETRAIQVNAADEANQPPQIDFIAQPQQAQVGEDIFFDATGTTASNPIVSYEWDFGDGSADTGSQVQHSYNQAQDYTVELTVTDDQGLSNSLSQQVSITAAPVTVPAPLPEPDQPDLVVPPQPSQPPQAVIDGPDQGEVGQELTFDGGFSSGDSPIAGYEWDFGDGGTATGMGVTYSYSTPGAYQVTLTVTDQNGQQGVDSKVVQIDPAPTTKLPEQPTPAPEQPTPVPEQPTPVPEQPTAEPPQAVINVEPQQGPYLVGQLIQFDGGFSTSSSPIVEYVWDFGDNTPPATGMGVPYTYLAAGTYNVTLRVTDQNGQSDTSSIVIQVDAPAAQPQPAQPGEPAPQQPAPQPQTEPTEPPPAPEQQSQPEPEPTEPPPPPEPTPEPPPTEPLPPPEPEPAEPPPTDEPAPDSSDQSSG